MEVKFCGGSYEVGASCILLTIAGKRILLDCGIRMTGDALPNLEAVKQSGGLDLILVSHAHMDHIGALPIVSSAFPQTPIIMTHMTKELAKILLYDSLKIMDLKEDDIPMFSEIHVENMLNRTLCYSPNYDIYPFLDDFQIIMYPAGHIPGAVCFYLITGEGSFFYSGDFSMTPQLAVGGAVIGKLRPDVAVLESTYGNRLHSSREQELSALLKKIVEVVEAGNKILIPAFALGRAQEILLFLNNAFAKKTAPRFPIYVDGMVNDICRAFYKAPNYLKERYAKKIYKNMDIFYNDNVVAVPRNMTARKEIANKPEGACIIASSGMLTGGPSAFYAAALCGNENNYIALTGYQDEESPGARLLELARGTDENRNIRIGNTTVEMKCGVGIYGLSAHADQSEILALAHALAARQTFFVHGSQEAIHEIAGIYQKESRGKVDVPQNGDTFSLDYMGKKRKQKEKAALVCMKSGMVSESSNLKALWEFILEHYSNKKGFPVEELYYILTGAECRQEEVIQWNQRLYESEYFTAELKRPYIFHAVLPEEIVYKDEQMEVNQALAYAEQLFEPFGLYKKGAKFDQKVITLYFYFPAIATAKAAEAISRFEAESKWTTQVNEEINLIAAEELIEALLKDCRLQKAPSYHRVERCFRIMTDSVPADYREIEEQFYKQTGVLLYFQLPSSQSVSAITRKAGQAEQNVALAEIEALFSRLPAKPYKKSLKADEKGSFIELSFLSPGIGQRYQEEINNLEMKLGWRIEIGMAVNQNEIFKMGKGILNQYQLVSKKAISYHPDKQKFVVQVLPDGGEAEIDGAKQEFLDRTGMELEIVRLL